MGAWLRITGPNGEDVDRVPITMNAAGDWEMDDGPYGLCEYCESHDIADCDRDDIENCLMSYLNAPISTGVAMYRGFEAEITSEAE